MRIRPDTGPTDRRRILAAAMSSLIPGLGQAWNGRRTMAVRLAVPFLVVVALVGLALVIVPGPSLVAGAIIPSTLQGLLALNLVVLGWRLVALGQAFFDPRFALRPGRLGLGGLAIVILVTAAPHLAADYVGGLARDSFARVFDEATLGGASAGPGPTPGSGERLNVLLMGVDAGGGRDHALTDTLIVVSVDPVGKSISMASVPRDLVDVPLGDGRTFGPKLNSLMSYAGRHPDEFPKGGIRALEDAIGALLGIPIHYYATVDMGGFVRMIDAVGGVDVNVKQALDDPKYKAYGVGRGWSVAVGQHHFDGAEALAYARIRRSEGQTDFTRADRQQEVLVALREQGRPGRRTVQPAGPAGRGRPHDQDGPSAGAPAGPRGAGRRGGREAPRPGRRPLAARPPGRAGQPIWIRPGPAPRPDPGDGEGRCSPRPADAAQGLDPHSRA